jgi:amino acid adenylation domain-containing protein
MALSYGWQDDHAVLDGFSPACIHTLFEQQALRTPDAAALLVGDDVLTYRQLNQRANRLAHHLRQIGVGPETLVGICVERSAWLLPGLLAILKAGGAYVPIDPAYPLDRVTYILGDAQASVVLTQTHLRHLVQDSPAQVVCLDADWDDPQAARDHDLDVGVRPDQLAYLIYTSGSTGRPKGVAIAHSAANALLRWASQLYSPRELAGVLAATSICFDLSVFELFLPLSLGGAVILAQNALALPTLPAREQVTLVNTVPSAMAHLVQTGGVPESVITVNLAGEPLKRALADRVYALPNVERLYNLYGPSEDTTYSTWLLVDRLDRDEPTIGVPIDGTASYVLDDQLRPTPHGEIGELYLSGAGLARGYWQRPALTAERFLPDPLGPAGARMYRTGDRTRVRADGQLEYLGRVDHQVKVRGFRIELGEIEAALSRHSAMHNVVVVAREDALGQQQLVAYVEPPRGAAPTVSELRRSLRESLPEYMVPAAFVLLDALPLTPNGKIDRKALPEPDLSRPDLDAEFVAPRTPLETQLAAIWRETLGVAQIGVHDSYFDLGGHSLLATRILSRVRDVIGAVVALPTLFANPTIAALARAIERDAPAELSAPDIPLRRGMSADPPRAAINQIEIWFNEQINHDGPLYNIQLHLRAHGDIDPALLQRSFDLLVERHAALRTTLQPQEDTLRLSINPPQPVAYTLADLRIVPTERQGATVLSMARQEAARPFDISRDQLIRLLAIQTADDRYELIVTIHHVAFDGWATGVLLQELGAIYRALAAGAAPPPLETLEYHDAVQWQAERIQGRYAEQLERYWRQQLDGLDSAQSITLDRPRPAKHSDRGAKITRMFPADLLAALESFSRREQASLYMTLLAGLQTLIHRHTGRTDIAISSPVANRTRREFESIIGIFINTLVLRSDLGGNPSFRELLGRVRQTALDAFVHQEWPFLNLIRSLNPDRELSQNALFQIMLVVQNVPLNGVDLPAGRIEYLGELDTGISKVDISIYVDYPAQGPTIAVEYATDLFEAATIERFLDQLLRLLRSAVADADQPISDLPLLDPAERRRLLYEWNDTGAPTRKTTLHTLIAEQASRTPDAIAVVAGDRQLSYGALDRRANQLAHLLRAQGVGPEARVGVYLDRSIEMVVALLAVLKAGGAYLPLDPSHPRDRLRFTLEDAQATVLLTQQHLREELAGGATQIIALDGDAARISAQPEHDPAAEVGLDQLAYLIYTSGSTGRPKGVQIEHRALVNFLQAMRRQLVVHAGDTFLALTTISFDIAALELWLPLTIGARTLIVDRETALDGAALAAALTTLRPTIVQATPATWRMLIAAGWQGRPDLKALCGGEALPADLARELLLRCGILWNMYGPTEATVWATFDLVEEVDRPIVPIGRPIDNLRAYILDGQQRPVPIGVPGELYIGGAGVARGYWNRPELTAERFIPNPFLKDEDARIRLDPPSLILYKTGDLARWLPDGTIEFLGRNDHQVKLRGFRIELGEIEAALLAHAALKSCVVIGREDSSPASGRPDQRLVAYLVPAPGAALDQEALRAALRTTLPDYMIPSHFITLDALPLTPNGKIDRRALPAPTVAPGERVIVPPQTPFEEIVAEVWSEVLTVDPISIHDNFFSLGGHSLLATQVMWRIRERFDLTLPVRVIFQQPTIAGLASCVEEAVLAELAELDD